MPRNGLISGWLGVFLLLLSFHSGNISASTIELPGEFQEPPICRGESPRLDDEDDEDFGDEPDDEYIPFGVAPFWTVPVKYTFVRGSVPVGNTVKFRCQASGRPLPSIIWLKNGKRITKPDVLHRMKLRPQQWTLVIANVTSSDRGNYTCLARNRYGVRCHTYYIAIENPAQRLTLEVGLPANQTVVVGSDAEFTCKAYSLRPISMKWLKNNEVNGTKYGPDGRPYLNILKTTNETFDVLRLHNVTPEDAGKYTCLAEEPMSNSMSSAWLTVLPEPRTDPTSEDSLVQSGNKDLASAFDVLRDLLDRRLLSLERRLSELEKHVFSAKNSRD